VGPRFRLDGFGKSRPPPPPGFDLRFVQSVASRYARVTLSLVVKLWTILRLFQAFN